MYLLYFSLDRSRAILFSSMHRHNFYAKNNRFPRLLLLSKLGTSDRNNDTMSSVRKFNN